MSLSPITIVLQSFAPMLLVIGPVMGAIAGARRDGPPHAGPVSGGALGGGLACLVLLVAIAGIAPGELRAASFWQQAWRFWALYSGAGVIVGLVVMYVPKALKQRGLASLLALFGAVVALSVVASIARGFVPRPRATVIPDDEPVPTTAAEKPVATPQGTPAIRRGASVDSLTPRHTLAALEKQGAGKSPSTSAPVCRDSVSTLPGAASDQAAASRQGAQAPTTVSDASATPADVPLAIASAPPRDTAWMSGIVYKPDTSTTSSAVAPRTPIFLNRGHGYTERLTTDSAGRFNIPLIGRERLYAVLLICTAGGIPDVVRAEPVDAAQGAVQYRSKPLLDRMLGRVNVRAFGWNGPIPHECPGADQRFGWRFPREAKLPPDAVSYSEPDWDSYRPSSPGQPTDRRWTGLHIVVHRPSSSSSPDPAPAVPVYLLRQNGQLERYATNRSGRVDIALPQEEADSTRVLICPEEGTPFAARWSARTYEAYNFYPAMLPRGYPGNLPLHDWPRPVPPDCTAAGWR